MVRLQLCVAACVFIMGSGHPKPSRWSSLHDGLNAWEAFKFDTHFTYEVTVGSKTVFRYPGSFEYLPPSLNSTDFQIIIKGAKEDGTLLKKVTSPDVAAILAGKNPGATGGYGSVAREELLGQGGGLTVLGLLKAVGREPKKGSDKWQVLREVVDAWAALQFDVNFTMNVGDTSGPLFTYTKGSTGMHTRLPGASLSKWPAALMISGLVADGTLSYDDKASKHLKWWTSDPQDPRSQVTLRHMLTFQTGYLEDAFVKCAQDPHADYLTCTHELYKASKLKANPGTSWAYLSCHLQFAGAIAVAATGLSPEKLFEKYLYGPVGMNETTWTPLANPQMATGITTTGSDFQKMMHKMLSYEFLGKKVLDEMERDWSAPPVSPSGDGWFGHYGMGHWFDCLGYSAGQKAGASAALTKFCLDEAIPSGPGAYAYFPLIDRKRKYYFQIVVAEDSQCRSEIPEYLRIIAKPLVDAIIQGTPVNDEQLLSRMGGLVLREITDIYNYIPPQCQPKDMEWPPAPEEPSSTIVV